MSGVGVADAEAALHDLEVRELPLPSGSAVELGQLRADTGLKLPDCCVLLAAEEAHARLASFDDRLATVAAQRDVVAITS